MRTILVVVLCITGLCFGAVAPSIDIWTAAAEGNVQVIKQHIEAGTDLNGRESVGGSTPLTVAALLGQAEVARILIDAGAAINERNNDGATALHVAAFFAYPEVVTLLLDAGADAGIKNVRDETALDTVTIPWSQGLADIYKHIGDLLELELDLDRIKTNLPKVATLLKEHVELSASASAEEVIPTDLRGAYFVNGEIHVNTYGTPEGKALTSGFQDFKPSWSQTGDMLVFFRRLKNDPVVTNWKTAICVIKVDGTGFQQLTDGTHTDFNQTWTRDGNNTPIWNRKNPATGGFIVMQTKVGSRPGQEVALTDKRYHTWAYSCLKDGRILVQCAHPQQGWGYFLMKPNPGGEPWFERIDCSLAVTGLLDRVSISPSETRVCFEYQVGHQYKNTGRTLYVADFDVEKPAITNPMAFANETKADRWFAYPRWSKDESAIVYHASPSLYLYSLKDGKTRKVSTNDKADYRYPHCEAAPK